MDTLEIYRTLRDVPLFAGVYPCDLMPTHPLSGLVSTNSSQTRMSTPSPLATGSPSTSTRDSRAATTVTRRGSSRSPLPCDTSLDETALCGATTLPCCRVSPPTCADSTPLYSSCVWTGDWVLAILLACLGQRNRTCSRSRLSCVSLGDNIRAPALAASEADSAAPLGKVSVSITGNPVIRGKCHRTNNNGFPCLFQQHKREDRVFIGILFLRDASRQEIQETRAAASSGAAPVLG
jgi:hypothetical protein